MTDLFIIRGDRTGIAQILYDKKYIMYMANELSDSVRQVKPRRNYETVYTLNNTELIVFRSSEVGPLIDAYYKEHKCIGAAKLAFTMKMM